jgi:polar amino acid transport system substrate-binding protein
MERLADCALRTAHSPPNTTHSPYSATMAHPLPADLVQAFAPTGRLRASINLGNPILAGRRADSGEVYGVSVDLARGWAHRLGVELALVVVDTAGQSVERVRQEEADIGFFAVDPARSQGLHFTAPYVLIEGSYLVRADSPLTRNEGVDRAGTRLVVGLGSAYDLFLTREIRHATLERAPSSPAVVDHFLGTGADVAAGVKQQLEADAARLGGLRLLPGRFMVIQQAMGCPQGRGHAAAAALAAYVEEMKASGFVAEALARHGIEGASVAPAA